MLSTALSISSALYSTTSNLRHLALLLLSLSQRIMMNVLDVDKEVAACRLDHGCDGPSGAQAQSHCDAKLGPMASFVPDLPLP